MLLILALGSIHVVIYQNVSASGDEIVSNVIEINTNTENGPVLNYGDYFGSSTANIGDLNGDGISDIAVGARYDGAGGALRGAIHVMLMNSDGSVSSTIEINSNTANGPVLNNADQFGSSIANIGDLNGDGISDIAVGAHYDDAGGTDQGAIHIMFMNSNGTVSRTMEINDHTANGPVLNNADYFGYSIANIGDLNGDGILDIAVGAYYSDASGFDQGAIHIMFMNSNGTVSRTMEINDYTANGPVLNAFDYFGYSIANIGDLNGDGISDIAVGAPDDDAGGTDRGAIHVMFMNSDGTVSRTMEINDHTANGPTLNNGDYFGSSIANIGDLNDDGISDIAVGALYDDTGGTDRGAIHVMFMNSDGTVFRTMEINDHTANGPTLHNSHLFGSSIANIGDLNGDGISDIAVGAPGANAHGVYIGSIHIMLMNSAGTVSRTIEINDHTANGPALNNFDYFGYSTANIGDLNGDGISDIVVGAPNDDAGGTSRGAIHVMLMNSDETVSRTIEINDHTANGPALNYGDYFGYSTANIGDLNGDGISDIAVGAPYDDAGGADRGAIHVMLMNSDGTVSRTMEINDHTENGPVLNNDDYFGSSIANIGDLNGDGISDIVVGASRDDAGGADRGAIHVMLMNSDGTVSRTIEINDYTANGPALNNGDYFGSSIANIGDLNGDGISDIVVGAPNDDAGGTSRGAIHVMLMNSDGTVFRTMEINDHTANGPALNNGDYFGSSIANIGDLNDDGILDIAVGAPNDNAGGTNRGAIHVMLMNSDGTVSYTIEINDHTTNGPALNNGDYFGSSIANIGDLNDDGILDIAVGAYLDDVGSNHRGTIHILFMKSVDITPPVITLIGNNPQLLEFGDGYTELGATTNHNSVVTINSDEFTDAVGTYSIYYDSTDASGFSATQVIRTVNVVDITPTLSGNLLNNPYSLSSWTIHSNGGNGWLDISSGKTNWVTSDQTFATSHEWAEKSQTVPITSTDGTLILTEDYSKTYCGEYTGPYINSSPYDRYYLTMILLDSSGNEIETHSTGIISMTDSCDWGRNWQTAAIVVDSIPDDTVAVKVKHGGASGERLTGWFGPVMKDIKLIHQNYNYDNLLNNPYSLSSWTIHSNGGNGWLDISSGKTNWVTSDQTFATSYEWAEKSQTVPITSTDGTLILTEDYSKTYCGEYTGPYINSPPYDRYYLAMILLDSSGNEIETHQSDLKTMKDSCDWGRNWQTAVIVVDSIPDDTVAVKVKHGGVSGERLTGWYGPVMKDIKIIHVK